MQVRNLQMLPALRYLVFCNEKLTTSPVAHYHSLIIDSAVERVLYTFPTTYGNGH